MCSYLFVNLIDITYFDWVKKIVFIPMHLSHNINTPINPLITQKYNNHNS